MQSYDYEVVDANGQAQKGRLEADSPVDVVRRLGAAGLTVVRLNEARAKERHILRRPPGAAELVVAFHELATLLGSGVTLGDAVHAQSRGSHHADIAAAFTAIAKDLTRGQSFQQALGASGLRLPDYVHQLVEAGELSGRLPEALRRAVQQMEYDKRVSADIRAALTYPAILVAAGVSAVLLVFVFVVPQFASLLDDAPDLPWLAAAVLGAGVWFNDNAWMFAAALGIAALGLAALWRRPSARRRVVDGVATLPVLRDWLSEADTAKWAAVMGAMLASRVELMDALALAARGVRVSGRAERLARAVVEVRGGAALSAALEGQDALTPTGYNLIRVGEQSGKLAETMQALAALYEENSARRMQRVLTIIEPLAVLLIGGVLGTIMVGLLLAITSVNEIVL